MAQRSLKVEITGDARRLGNPSLWRRIRRKLRRRQDTALVDALAALRAEIAVQNEQAVKLNAVSYREALKFMADSISGEIVGRQRQRPGDGDIKRIGDD